MRKIILILFFALPLIASAQKKSEELMQKIRTSLGEMGAYDVKFKLSSVGFESIEGYFAIDGDKYYVLSGNLEVICDGKNTYNVNHTSLEVNIDGISQQMGDVLSNPSIMLEFSDALYEHELAGDNVLKLIPKDNSMGISQVLVSVSKIDNLPLHISYTMIDGGQTIDIELEKISKLTSKDKYLFQYKENNFSCYEIIDFR